ncbi:MAG: thiamine pyrophosphate-dependent enzyme, partial [Chloroflexota bacterium]|nr:thiamine pyrophosphate-dependent enzyme [Chloroflexota bacterium]
MATEKAPDKAVQGAFDAGKISPIAQNGANGATPVHLPLDSDGPPLQTLSAAVAPPATGDAGLDHETLREIYTSIALARALDERMWQLNRAGRAPFVVSGQGHEAAQVGAAFALDRAKDVILPYYRDLAFSLVFGLTAEDVMMAALARAPDPTSGARQM